MKKTVSIIYTVFVVTALLCVVAFFGWRTYQSRALRISDFTAKTDEYTHSLSSALSENRDVDAEVTVAEKYMKENPSLIAIQVYSHDDGLRLSVVKSIAGEFSRLPISDSDRFNSFPANIRYHKITKPMHVADMQGLEATYVVATLSGAEIRSNLLIILITVIGLFAITLVLILVKPGKEVDVTDEDEEEDNLPDFSSDNSPEGKDDFDLPDFDPANTLDENDLFGSGPEISDSIPMDDDFSLPELDDLPGESATDPSESESEIINRLELELERSASFNQDLSVLIFSGISDIEGEIQSSYTYEDLVFPLNNESVAVIEINKDLDTSLSITEGFIKEYIEKNGNRDLRVGIASRNGRLISAGRLFKEADNALIKTDEEKNIVAFRSDPEKYREFLKSKEA